MRTAWLTRDWTGEYPQPVPGGCAYYRCYLPMAVLNLKGSVLGYPVYDPIRGFGSREGTSTGLFGFNTVILKLIMDRTTPVHMRLARNNVGQRFIVDIDDFYQGLTEANKAWLLSHPDHNPNSNREFYEQVIAEADRLTVSTPFLHDYYKQRHPDVVMVRNAINPNQFPQRDQQIKPVIGWTGSTNFRNGDLEELRDWLPDFLEEHDLMFHHTGASPDAPPFHEITGVNPNRIRTSPLTSITNYASGFQFDIGIVPLRDIPFNHAKSNIKGLEYAAAGIPFIASDLPEYRLLHEQGIGLLATTPEDWKTNLTSLLQRRTRTSCGRYIRETVRRDWSIDTRRDEWAAAITG